mmetsp:Transcript_32134/g.84913  ORF Transcript_32134/g.84913 Transcript_32134/m.84913 type:complete len:190 (-) Transcript_32134:52-621(-)
MNRRSMSRSATADSGTSESIKDVFRKHDRDGNGGLNKTEFVALLSRCGMKRVNAASIFNIVDANNDDLIDFEEFVDWLHNKDGQMAAHRSSPNRTAAEHVLKFSTFKDPRVGHSTASVEDNLKKRFPRKTEDEVRQALLQARGHGGEAAAILAGQVQPDKTTSRIGHTAYALSGGGTVSAGRLREFGIM